MIKLMTCLAGAFPVVILSLSSVFAQDMFTGTWCMDREKLIISFDSESTLTVTNLQEEEVTENRGRYEKTDSTFTAIVESNDLSIRMGYKYKWKDKSELEAKILYITVDSDSIDHPERWLDMERCDPNEYFGENIVPDSSSDKDAGAVVDGPVGQEAEENKSSSDSADEE